jgi:peptidyl-prolyl cis-trans isomerase SurA
MKQVTLFILLFCSLTVFAQSDAEVLFTVEDTPVYVGEFKYIYEKTNQDNADYSQASVEEYLELYKKFKLKVQRAKDIELDTIQSLKKELAGYRKQLANSYMIDKEVTERLIKEAYERKKLDVNISHIMVQLKPGATPQDTLAKYNKIMDIYNQLKGGKKFEELVPLSEDKSSIKKRGNLGFVTAILPNGFYGLENAAYNTNVGGYSKPVRTKVGYHIVQSNGKRPARGEIEVAHILIRKANPNMPDLKRERRSKNIIDEIYAELEAGVSWDSLVMKSEDNTTRANGGSVGKFGIGRFEPVFEEAAFGIAEDGGYSTPFESKAGWHIIKRIKKIPLKSYDEERGKLQNRIKKDDRYEIAQASMIKRIQKVNNFKQYDKVVDQLRNSLNDEFTTYKWKANPNPSNKVIFTLGDESYIQAELEEFLEQSSRKRQRIGRSGDVASTFNTLYAEFLKSKTLEYEENQLERKFPEFKYLMNEYEEGILLFEATKTEIWDRASQDSAGLAKYYEQIRTKDKFQWKERAEVSFYTIKEESKDQLKNIRKMAVKKPTASILAKYNTEENKPLSVRRQTYERGKNKVVDAMKWKTGSISPVEVNTQNNSLNFIKIEKIIAPTGKTLSEARGYAVAEYQDYLERKWLEELRSSYKIVVNQETLDKLIK